MILNDHQRGTISGIVTGLIARGHSAADIRTDIQAVVDAQIHDEWEHAQDAKAAAEEGA